MGRVIGSSRLSITGTIVFTGEKMIIALLGTALLN
jgi:hypothetical protein